MFDSYFLSPHLECKLGHGCVLFTLCLEELIPCPTSKVSGPCLFVEYVSESLGDPTWGGKATHVGEDQCLQPLDRWTVLEPLPSCLFRCSDASLCPLSDRVIPGAGVHLWYLRQGGIWGREYTLEQKDLQSKVR